jgi:mannitol/fructose-specific phosphotransferase system IIA component (Ntr-type)
VSDLIPQELIFYKKRYRKKEEIIEDIGNILVEKGYVKHEFIKTALDREKITSTYIGKGVAIPHGEDRQVIKPAVSVITLSEPIDWWGEKVDLVFYLALHFNNSKYTKSFFKEFYDMMDNPELLKMIREAKNSLEINKILLKRGEI